MTRVSFPPLKARVAEAMRLRGVVSEATLHTILNAIYGSARDFGEYSLEAKSCEELAKISCGPHAETVAKIQTVVAEHFNLTRGEILSHHRFRRICLPRQIAVYLCKLSTPLSLIEIGKQFGGRDHTTVLYSVRKIARLIGTDKALADEISVLKGLLS